MKKSKTLLETMHIIFVNYAKNYSTDLPFATYAKPPK